MIKSVDILYFIEHTARELDIACAVKYLAQNKYNLRVEICSIAVGLGDTLARYQPEVVALPYCVSVHDLGLAQIVSHWPRARYINLSFEQLLGKTQKKFKAPRDDFSRQYVFHHAWGEFFAQYLQANHVTRSQIAVNGNPSYMLYRCPYKAYYQPRKELAQQYGLDPEKRWVFIPENYGWAFFEDHMLRDRIRRGFDPDDAYRYRDFARDSLRAAAGWWRDASKLDSIELIVRPRPAIPREQFIETVRAMAGDVPKTLHFIKQGTVREWILASDMIFSSYSTTLLEAAVAQKPLSMLMPFPFPDFLYAPWYDVAAKVETGDAFFDVLTQPQLESNWQPLENWVIDNMMSNGDAIANLADLFASVIAGDISVPQPVSVGRDLTNFSWGQVKRSLRKTSWNLYQSGLSALGIKTRDQVWNPHERDIISPDDVESRVARWAKVLN
ncbi:MAG: hypothetical protein U9Q82_15820 [Chloroflexota bacterium]|nr:hypothetical protein [Chloroflexota bacterium]